MKYIDNLKIQSLGFALIYEALDENQKNTLKTIGIGATAGVAGGALAASNQGREIINNGINKAKTFYNNLRQNNVDKSQNQSQLNNQAPQNQVQDKAPSTLPQQQTNTDATNAVGNPVEPYKPLDALSSEKNKSIYSAADNTAPNTINSMNNAVTQDHAINMSNQLNWPKLSNNFKPQSGIGHISPDGKSAIGSISSNTINSPLSSTIKPNNMFNSDNDGIATSIANGADKLTMTI